MQPSAAVYVTYVRKEDAQKAIHAVDGSVMMGRILRYYLYIYNYYYTTIYSMQCVELLMVQQSTVLIILEICRVQIQVVYTCMNLERMLIRYQKKNWPQGKKYIKKQI
jgi:hypothetical protein